MSALADLSLADAGELVGRRAVSSVALTEAILERIEEIDGRCNAFLSVLSGQALQAAAAADAELATGHRRGPMHGIPYGLKDIIDVAGLPTTCHSKIMAGHVAAEDAEVVGRLRAAGAVLVGKLALHEFATGGPTFDLPWPPARNPWDLARHPGGSSSGSAAAVAAGMIPAAIGTDTGGSVRNPATATGIVGMKPTYAAISTRGVFPLSMSLDHVGPITRTVEDNAILFQAIATPRAGGDTEVLSTLRDGVRGLRIGVIEHFHTKDADDAEADQVKGLDAAADALRALGAKVAPARVSPLATYGECGRIIHHAECHAVHAEWLRTRPEDYSALSRRKLIAGAFISAADYIRAQQARTLLAQEFATVMREFDAVIALSGFAAPCRIDSPADIERTYERHARMPFNVTGTPAIAVPTIIGSEGLPMGIQIAGPAFGERMVYRVAFALCEAMGSTERRPPIFGANGQP